MAENADQVLHFREYLKVIRNRLWVIITIFLLTVLSGAYVTEYVLVKVYTASALVQINRANSTDIQPFVSGTGPNMPFDPSSFQADFEIMQSSGVLLPIIKDLKLNEVWAKRVYKSNLDALPDLEALNYMSSQLHLDTKRGTNIIVITASSDVPQEAADIANALADKYKAIKDVAQDQQNNSGTESLRDQIAQQQKVVDDKKDEVEKLRQQANAAGVTIDPHAGGSLELLQGDLDSRKKDLLSAKEDYDGRKVLLEQLKPLSDDEFVNTMEAMNHEEADIASLRTDIFKSQSDIENLLKDGFEENHPRILAMKAEIDTKKEQIKGLIAGQRKAMELDTQVAQSRVALLQKEVDDLTAKTSEDQTTQLVPFREAQRELEQQQSVLDAFTIRLKQLLADRQFLQSPVVIISRAEPPENPSSPNKRLYMSVTIGAGLFVGIVVAFLIEYLDTSVKTMADAELLLGLPVLTVIPNKGGPMPLTQDAARLPHAEGYRILRAKLDLKVENGVGPSLSMLSGGPGEGKSTTIYNLAIVCAQAGQSVIIVDCDLRRPTIHELLNLPNTKGLANYLRGEGEAVEYIQQSALPKLHLLASGDMPMSEIGVLAGDKIRSMLEDLKQRYDLVLVDSPPVLGISDGSIIAREVDYVILVIQHRRYPREISLRAKRAIEEVHGNCVGMVLNCVSVKSDDAYYYYSSYGDYYNKTDRIRKKKSAASKSKAKVSANGANGTNGKPEAASSRKKDLDSEEF